MRCHGAQRCNSAKRCNSAQRWAVAACVGCKRFVGERVMEECEPTRRIYFPGLSLVHGLCAVARRLRSGPEYRNLKISPQDEGFIKVTRKPKSMSV
jgi:hypothetical protein